MDVRRLARTARVVLIGSAIGVTSTCSHVQLGGVVGAAEVRPVAVAGDTAASGLTDNVERRAGD